MSDLFLARRILAGDESAANEFFADYFPRLYRFARPRLGGDDAAAEDVVQATLVEGIRKLHTYRGEAALFTWLCTFCRHQISEWLERAGRRGEVGLVEDEPGSRAALDQLAAAAANPEREAEHRQIARLVQVTLDHLPARYASALEWRYIQGLGVSDISSRLDLGYKATESLLSRAREAFREGFSALTAERPATSLASATSSPQPAQDAWEGRRPEES